MAKAIQLTSGRIWTRIQVFLTLKFVLINTVLFSHINLLLELLLIMMFRHPLSIFLIIYRPSCINLERNNIYQVSSILLFFLLLFGLGTFFFLDWVFFMIICFFSVIAWLAYCFIFSGCLKFTYCKVNFYYSLFLSNVIPLLRYKNLQQTFIISLKSFVLLFSYILFL